MARAAWDRRGHVPGSLSRSGEFGMVQKIIDVAGSSPTSFAKAADDAVKTAAETVRNRKWARVSELAMGLDGQKVKSYRVTVRISLDVERSASLDMGVDAKAIPERTPHCSPLGSAPSNATRVR